jgi:Holliday junction resolvase-like predicted endonuclease
LRPELDAAILAVNPRGRVRIETAGRSFIASRPHYAHFGVRYDILAIRGASVSHLRDAWRAEPRWR